jgi:hypothetical protein
LFDSIKQTDHFNLYNDYVIPASEYVFECADRGLGVEQLEEFGRFLQQLGLLMDGG